MPFEKGQSGNPAGRPRAGQAFNERLQAAETPADEQKIWRMFLAAVKRGEPWAVTMYFDRKYGKVPNRTLIGGDDEASPIPLIIERPAPLA